MVITMCRRGYCKAIEEIRMRFCALNTSKPCSDLVCNVGHALFNVTHSMTGEVRKEIIKIYRNLLKKGMDCPAGLKDLNSHPDF